jgi:UDP-glucose 4-epimerase
MKVLITGGAGFIGSNLAKKISHEGHDVVVLDDLSTGRLENIGGKAEFVYCDISKDVAAVDKNIRDCDFVCHLASVVGVERVLEDPFNCLFNNAKGTNHILDACLKYHKPILFSSSSEVYGISDLIMKENNARTYGATTAGRWSYATVKAYEESLVYFSDIPSVVVRFFNVSGPGQLQDYGMVIPTFIAKALAGEELTIHGDGTQQRCFMHIDDAVDALFKLIFRQNEMLLNTLFNLGSTSPITINDLAKLVIDCTNSPSQVRYEGTSQRDGGMRLRMADTSKLRQAINWQPKYTVKDIVVDSINYYRQREKWLNVNAAL